MAVQESPSLLFLNRSRLRTLRLTSTMPYSTAGALCCGSVFLASWERCSSYHWLGLEPAATSVATHISQKVENLSLLSTWQPVTGTGKKIIQLHLNTAKAPQKKKVLMCVVFLLCAHLCVGTFALVGACGGRPEPMLEECLPESVLHLLYADRISCWAWLELAVSTRLPGQ